MTTTTADIKGGWLVEVSYYGPTNWRGSRWRITVHDGQNKFTRWFRLDPADPEDGKYRFAIETFREFYRETFGITPPIGEIMRAYHSNGSTFLIISTALG